jgi:hypothetical protein
MQATDHNLRNTDLMCQFWEASDCVAPGYHSNNYHTEDDQ